MTYQEAVEYLFDATPVFQHVGGSAYKPGLERMHALEDHYSAPHKNYKTIHVAGTNGKGSTSHTLAAVLQSAGYRVGLFTSPHLVDFRERIRVNGEMIEKTYVCEFTEGARGLVSKLSPSFFELTTMMALCYFRDKQVDIAVIEVGLGGRLDSTNIVSPILSIITNISLDHTQFLGKYLESIAQEKAGIIKKNVPAVIGKRGSEGVADVFERKALEVGAPLVYAEDISPILSYQETDRGYRYKTSDGDIYGQLRGYAQIENSATILTALMELRRMIDIPFYAIQEGFAKVSELTGLRGRWQTIALTPRTVCDTGHNLAGIKQVLVQIQKELKSGRQAHMVIGFAQDKDVSAILELLPKSYKYYFTQASVSRALSSKELADMAVSLGLQGEDYISVQEALYVARGEAHRDDFIFVGGSNFVVADLLACIDN